MSRALLRGIVVWLCLPAPAHAQVVLTLEDVVARARERAGAVAVANARVGEAEAALLDATPRFREGPVVEGAVGPRLADQGTVTDVDLSVAQQFEVGGKRQARIDGATAAIDRQRAEVEQVARGVAFDAASAFLDAVAIGERVRMLEQADAVSRQLLAATERRYAAGDVAAIDVNLARIDTARSESALAAARADLASELGTLRALLQLPVSEPIDVRGTLDAAAPPALADLEATVDRRPDLAVLAADVREAEAQTRFGQSLRKPDLGVRLGYEREETNSIFLGGLVVTLPSYQRARGAVAAGLARTTRVRLEAETTRQLALTQLHTAYAVYEQRVALVAAFTKNALPSVDDNESLAQRSYDAGEMSLMDLLLIRRDGLETRTVAIERRLDAARSRLGLDFIAGTLR